MSNTDKLKERIKSYYDRYNIQEIAFQHDGGKGLQVLLDIVNNVPNLISQLEQSQQREQEAAKLLFEQSIKIQIFEKENEVLQNKNEQYRLSQLNNERLQAENEQLKADKKKLVGELDGMTEKLNYTKIYYPNELWSRVEVEEWESGIDESINSARQVLSEVKGNA